MNGTPNESTSLLNAPETLEEGRALAEVRRDIALFELAQRKAQVYASSTLVPKEYQENIGNVMIATNMANRLGADVLMVMQNLYVVHGKPGWSAQFLIASFNTCGRFSAIGYKFSGSEGSDDWGCRAYSTEMASGQKIWGTTVTIRMAKSEGWTTKQGSKWKTMPEQMLRYRAATFFVRSTAPEIAMGLLTKEELEDMPDSALPREPAVSTTADGPALTIDALIDPKSIEPGETSRDRAEAEPTPKRGTDQAHLLEETEKKAASDNGPDEAGEREIFLGAYQAALEATSTIKGAEDARTNARVEVDKRPAIYGTAAAVAHLAEAIDSRCELRKEEIRTEKARKSDAR